MELGLTGSELAKALTSERGAKTVSDNTNKHQDQIFDVIVEEEVGDCKSTYKFKNFEDFMKWQGRYEDEALEGYPNELFLNITHTEVG